MESSYICVWTLGLDSNFWVLTLLDLEVTLVLDSIPVGNHLSKVTLKYKRSLYFEKVVFDKVPTPTQAL